MSILKNILFGNPSMASVGETIKGLDAEDEAQKEKSKKRLLKMGEKAIEPMIESFHKEGHNLCVEIAYVLGEIGEAAVLPLIQVLETEKDEIAYHAAIGLGKTGDIRAVKPLIKALSRDDSSLRAIAAQALGDIGDPKAVDDLIKATNDSDDWVRENASVALAEIDDPKAKEAADENLIVCFECKESFSWDDGYRTQNTPGSQEYNPSGCGNGRARVYCPHCGNLIVEQHLNEDYEWGWFGENSTVNGGRPLPGSPLTLWGKSIPPQVLPSYENHKLDIEELIKITNEQSKIEETNTHKCKEELSWQELSQKGLDSFNSGNIEEAAQWIKKAADLGMPKEDYAMALGSLGEEGFLLQKKDIKSAQKYLEESVSVSFHTWFKAHYILSWIYEERGDANKAERKLKDGQRANFHKSIESDYEQKIRSVIRNNI